MPVEVGRNSEHSNGEMKFTWTGRENIQKKISSNSHFGHLLILLCSLLWRPAAFDFTMYVLLLFQTPDQTSDTEDTRQDVLLVFSKVKVGLREKINTSLM